MAVGIPKNSSSKRTDFNLSYASKKDVEEILNSACNKEFSVIATRGQNSINSLYFGDNLDVLQYLSADKNVKGKVDLIYIDPPFAKGAHFSSRSQELAYTDILDGSEYIEFLRVRLYLMKELLSEKGSIYVHLDETMAFEIKIIMDEIFGKKNFRNWIVRKKSNPKNSISKKYGNITDYIMFYTKSSSYIFNQPYEPWEEEALLKEYTHIEEETGRRYKRVPIHAPGIRNGETGKPWRGKLPPEGKHWQYAPSKLDELDENGEIYWSKNGNPRRKVYMDQNKGKKVQDIWLDFKDAHNQNVKITGYPTEKNMDLLERIIKASSNENSIVLDAFNGSGTTLSVASKLNRNWIAIDNSKLSIETTLKRIFNGTEKMGDFVNKNNTSIELELFDYKNEVDDFSLISESSLIDEIKLEDFKDCFD
ncbi:TPA: site-specific DNA-methyltransferase [Streptococcus suis]|nr:site-specific DNA-methyltransferase [Streptococcus suis]HEM2814275.1 site-specific DNA-methyltransferase [Streptococcus suis]HEM5207863.1 site-specific DNA-methyltransferase [Streptococcus suis]